MADNGHTGQQTPTDTASEFNAMRAVVRALIARINTCTEVQVVAVTNAGDLSPVGFVDVQPLVNQLDGAGKSIPHGVLHRLPYFRLQGGTDAVIIDPKVGDIGIAVFADHDISAVANAKAQANPGSGRRFDMADGLYIGGVLNGVPEQYIRFHAGGIDIVSPTKIRLAAPEIEIDGDSSIKLTAPTIDSDASTSITLTASEVSTNAPVIGLNGAVTQTAGSAGAGTVQLAGPLNVTSAIHSDDDVTAGTVSLHGHVHGGVAPGGDSTDAPTS
jgi:GpV Apex motif